MRISKGLIFRGRRRAAHGAARNSILHQLYLYGFLVALKINSDPFAYLNGTQGTSSIDANGITTDENLMRIGASWYQLMEVIGIIGTIVTIIFLAIKLIAVKNDPRIYEETKRGIVIKCMVCALIFAFIAIAGIIFNAVSSI